MSVMSRGMNILTKFPRSGRKALARSTDQENIRNSAKCIKECQRALHKETLWVGGEQEKEKVVDSRTAIECSIDIVMGTSWWALRG